MILWLISLSLDTDFAKTIVRNYKEVVPRLSIRGFRDDYHDVNTDVVVLSRETFLDTKPVSRCVASYMCGAAISKDSSEGHAFYGGYIARES